MSRALKGLKGLGKGRNRHQGEAQHPALWEDWPKKDISEDPVQGSWSGTAGRGAEAPGLGQKCLLHRGAEGTQLCLP